MSRVNLPLKLACAVCLWMVLQAHRSLPPAVTCGNQFNSSATAITIPDPKISWASYRILTCDAPVFWLKGDMFEGQVLAMTVGLPVLSRFADVRVAVAIIGPGLPALSQEDQAMVPSDVLADIKAGEGAVLVKSPQNQSTCSHLNSKEMAYPMSKVTDGRCIFHEEYGDSHSYVLIDQNISTAKAGEHRFALFTTTNNPAKVWFACCDWPEDFATPYDIPAADCPYCATKESFGNWMSHYYEQKAMVPYAGFPAAMVCENNGPVTAPLAKQCPPAPAKEETQSENCKLGCSNGDCHSHNVLGECTYTVKWVTPRPTMGNANVSTLRIFAGERVKFLSQGHMFAHNLHDMKSATNLESCNFDPSAEVGNVEELNAGKIVNFTKAGTFYYSCKIGNHCNQGQQLTVIVKDVSEGMRCHDHDVESPDLQPKACPEGTITASILGSSDYGASADQCSEFCTSEQGLAWISGAKKGSCKDEGFDTMVKEAEVQPAGSPQKMTVIVMSKEASCAEGTIQAYMLESESYGAGKGECSELCTSEAALQWMAGGTKGSCKSAGYGKMVKQMDVQPPGSPQKMSVAIMAKETSCHCHSYEEIACDSTGDALYDEHIDEIVEHCAGVISGSESVCPYKCHQPFEVLHLYYLECNSRPIDATYIQINKSATCHQAASASSHELCGPGEEKTPEHDDDHGQPKQPAASNGTCAAGTVQAYVLGSSDYGAEAGQCSEFCTLEAGLQWIEGAKKGACKDEGFDIMVKEELVQPQGSPQNIKVTVMGKTVATGTDTTGAATTGAVTTAPTDAAAVPTAVKVTMKVQGIKLDELEKNATLLQGFKATVKEAIAAQAGPGIAPEHVTLKLSSGSVVIEATITPPTGIAVGTVQSSMNTNAAAVGLAVTDKVKLIPGIAAAKDPSVEITVDMPTVVAVKPVETTSTGSPGGNTASSHACPQHAMQSIALVMSPAILALSAGSL